MQAFVSYQKIDCEQSLSSIPPITRCMKHDVSCIIHTLPLTYSI